MPPVTFTPSRPATGTSVPVTISLQPSMSCPGSVSLKTESVKSVALICSLASLSVISHISLQIHEVSPGSGCISIFTPELVRRNTPAGRKTTPRLSSLEVVSTIMRPRAPAGAFRPGMCCRGSSPILVNRETAEPEPKRSPVVR